MAYTGSVPSGFNTFTPNFEASGQLIVNYSRNVRKFAINRYLQIVKVAQDQFFWLAITPDSAGRIGNTNLADFTWADGQLAPSGLWNNTVFNWNLSATSRYAYPFLLGQKAVAQATWPIIAVEAGQMAQLAMTGRTLLTASLLFNSSNFDSNHTSSVSSIITTNFPALTAGTWGQGTNTNPIIQACLAFGAQQIQKTTLSAVERGEMILLVSPTVATKMAVSQEVHNYFSASPFAAAQLRGDVPWLNGNWGLPDVLYNTQVVVDDTSYVSSELGASTTTFNYVYDAIATNDAVLISRPGGLEGSYGTRSFSTVTGFFFEELTTETLYDSINRLYHGRVVDDYGIVLTAPAASFLFTSVV